MADGQSGAGQWMILFGVVLMGIAFLMGVVAMKLERTEGVDRERVMMGELALSYTAGLCATGGPGGAAFYCGDWGFPRQVGGLFYRCGLEMVDRRRIMHRLHVAQFASEGEALRGANITSAVSCDLEGNVFTDNPTEWNIPSIKHLQFD